MIFTLWLRASRDNNFQRAVSRTSCFEQEIKERYQYYVHAFEQSRRFRSLKVWMSFKRYGTRQIGEWVDNNVRQALHLYSLVADKRTSGQIV
jgi:glutamate/tyrosine decarboxylase-like PLP-dependent enzyme